MQIKHKVLYAGRRKVLRVTSLATIESGPFTAADDPIRKNQRTITYTPVTAMIKTYFSRAIFTMGPIPLLNSRKTDRNGFLAGDSRPGR